MLHCSACGFPQSNGTQLFDGHVIESISVLAVDQKSALVCLDIYECSSTRAQLAEGPISLVDRQRVIALAYKGQGGPLRLSRCLKFNPTLDARGKANVGIRESIADDILDAVDAIPWLADAFAQGLVGVVLRHLQTEPGGRKHQRRSASSNWHRHTCRGLFCLTNECRGSIEF